MNKNFGPGVLSPSGPMQKEKEMVTNNKAELESRIAQLEAENIALRQKEVPQQVQDGLLKELDELNRRSINTSGRLTVKEIDDHKNIALYHTNGHQVGKKMGPMHPSNARVEMERSARRGLRLSVIKPTEEFIAAYKKTPEWIKLEEAFQKDRAKKLKSKTPAGIDRIVTAIEKMSGQTVVNRIAEKP